jgi:hypothetical protein
MQRIRQRAGAAGEAPVGLQSTGDASFCAFLGKAGLIRVPHGIIVRQDFEQISERPIGPSVFDDLLGQLLADVADAEKSSFCDALWSEKPHLLGEISIRPPPIVLPPSAFVADCTPSQGAFFLDLRDVSASQR